MGGHYAWFTGAEPIAGVRTLEWRAVGDSAFTLSGATLHGDSLREPTRPMLTSLGSGTLIGVLAAVTSSLTPTELRTTGLAALTACVALARFGSSLLVGQLWDRLGVRPTFLLFGLALVVFACSLFILAIRRRQLLSLIRAAVPASRG